jgi:hypothetical protein
LDRFRENIQVLDESIESIRRTPKDEKPAEKRARLKLLRDYVELENATLTTVKTHLLGRDETGAPIEPADHYEGNEQVEFERYFSKILSQWTRKDFKLECSECHRESEDVTRREIVVGKESWGSDITEGRNLCPECYDKLSAQPEKAENENSETLQSTKLELGEIDLSTPEKCNQLIERIKSLQAAGRLEPGQARVMIQTVNNALELHKRAG